MKFSEMWLREWINPPINSIELTNQLTMIGLKVNEFNPVSDIFYNIIIGKIIKYEIHPQLNTYRLIKVDIGNNKLLNIVCNDFQYQKNMKVAIANIGALLPNGTQVKLIKVHGRLSEGILCSFSMLKLINNDHDNEIIELPSDAPIGQEIYNYLHLNDNIIDINIPPNRGDCLNIIGIAREVAIINQLEIKKLKIGEIIPQINDVMSVIIEDNTACPQFLGRIIKNLNVTITTPLWIKEKLRRSGIYSVNVVIDITNYVLLELGHPVYAFDYEAINGNILHVRFSKKEEIFTSSDNNRNIQLFPNTLIISDQKKILSIAGINIGQEFCVHANTYSIFLQSAYFNPLVIAGKSKLYNIHSLSSIRYERGIDSNISQLALNYVTSLLLNICHGDPGPIVHINDPHTLPQPISITLHRKKIDQILGFRIIDQDVLNILKRLGFQQIKLLDNKWKFSTPTWRHNISIEENIISEIVRIYGYNKIPYTSAKSNFPISCSNKLTIPLMKIKSLLVTYGYQEAITYSFVSPEIQKLFNPKKIPLKIINPITLDMSVMRTSLWESLIGSIIYNQNRQKKYIRLFESGMCFTIKKHHTDQKICQKFMIAGIRSGFRFDLHWDLTTHLIDFYDIKGDVENIFRIINKLNNVKFKKCTHPALHPGQSAIIYFNNQPIGYIGTIHPSIQIALNLNVRMLAFELSWRVLSKIISPTITNVSKFPKNFRDISMIIPNHIASDTIISACQKISDNQLIGIKLFDVYTGKDIPKGFKSFTIKLLLQSKIHTLSEKEITNIVQKCINMLKKHFHAVIR